MRSALCGLALAGLLIAEATPATGANNIGYIQALTNDTASEAAKTPPPAKRRTRHRRHHAKPADMYLHSPRSANNGPLQGSSSAPAAASSH